MSGSASASASASSSRVRSPTSSTPSSAASSRTPSRINSPRNNTSSNNSSNGKKKEEHKDGARLRKAMKKELEAETTDTDHDTQSENNTPRETSPIVSAEEVQRRKDKIKKWMAQEDRERAVRREKIAATSAARSDIALRIVLAIWACMIILIFYHVLTTIQAGRTVIPSTSSTTFNKQQAPFRPFK